MALRTHVLLDRPPWRPRLGAPLVRKRAVEGVGPRRQPRHSRTGILWRDLRSTRHLSTLRHLVRRRWRGALSRHLLASARTDSRNLLLGAGHPRRGRESG